MAGTLTRFWLFACRILGEETDGLGSCWQSARRLIPIGHKRDAVEIGRLEMRRFLRVGHRKLSASARPGCPIVADEFRQLADERTADSITRMALIERSIPAMLVVGLLIGVLAMVKPVTTAILFDAALATAAWPFRQNLVRAGSIAATFLLLSPPVLVVLLMPVVCAEPRGSTYPGIGRAH